MERNVILTPKNEDALQVNIEVLKRFPGEEGNYKSIDTPIDDNQDGSLYPVEFINTLTPNNMPPNELRLKEGVPLMLLRNLDPSQGLANGTRFVVLQHSPRLLYVKIITESFYGKKVFIPRIPLLSDDDERQPCKFKRLQFPVRLGFAMTINKSQGQTIERVGLYLKEPVFGHGQLYVALSRVKGSRSIRVFVEDGSMEGKEGIYTKNIVYKQILQ